MSTNRNSLFEILIADDNVQNLQIISEILSNSDYVIRLAKNGKQVLSSIELSPPSLVILDVNMPIMDGYEVCNILKKEDSMYKEIPIIFLSAFNDSSSRSKAFKMGAADFISKPFVVPEIQQKIDFYMNYCMNVTEIKRLNTQLMKLNKEAKDLKKRLN